MSSLLPADEREALCAQRMAWKPGRREITAWWDTLLDHRWCEEWSTTGHTHRVPDFQVDKGGVKLHGHGEQ